jgi:WD40 repeat protein
VLDVTSGGPLYSAFGSGADTEDVCLNPATYLALTTEEGSPARLWDIRTGQPVAWLTYGSDLFRGTLSRDGQWAAAISDGTNAVIWNTHSNAPWRVLHSPGSGFLHLAFSPDAKQIITSGWDHEPFLWEVATGRLMQGLTNHTDAVYWGAFSPDGTWVATASLDRSVRIWDTATGQEQPPCLKHDDGVFDVEFSADGRCLATAGLDFTARIWDLRTREQLLLLPHHSKVVCVSFSPQGRYLVTATHDGTVRVWDLRKPSADVRPLAEFSKDGRRMVQIIPEGLLVLDTHDEQRVALLPFTNVLATSLLLSLDGMKVVTVENQPLPEGTTNSLVWLWDCSAWPGRQARSLTLEAGLNNYELSRNGTLLFASGETNWGVWDLGTGRQILKRDQPVRLGAFDPAGERIAVASTGSTNEVQLWHLATGRPLLSPPWHHETEVSSIEWSPNGKLVVTACRDNTFDPEAAQVWDAATGYPVGPPLQHRDGVCFAAFNHQGNQVITCSEDFTAILWEPATFRQLVPPLRHRDQVKYAAFSENDRWIATVCQDGTIRLWEAASGEPLTPPLPCSADPPRVHWLDHDRCLAGPGNGASWFWKLPCDTRPVADLVRIAQLLSAEQIHDGEALVPQTKDALQAIWQQLRTNYPEEFSLRP